MTTGDVFVTHNVQLGSSGELRVSDDAAWYVIRETWQRGLMLNAQVISKHATRLDALRAKIEADGGPRHLKCAPGQTVWDCLEEAGVLYTRIGGWHEQPRENEVLVATVRVHPHDPDVPAFYAELE